MNNTSKLSCLLLAGILTTSLTAQAAVIFDMGTLTTTGEDNTGWDGGTDQFLANDVSGRGSSSPFWAVWTTAAIYGTSSGGDTLAAGDYTVTFDAGWAYGAAYTAHDINSFQAFAWDGTTETALEVSSSYDLVTYQTWQSCEYTFSIADGADVIGQDLRLKFSVDGGVGVDTFVVSSIPEPGTYALIGGLLALSSVMLRRR